MTSLSAADTAHARRYIGFWRRSLAAYVDFLLIALVVSPLRYQVHKLTKSLDAPLVRGGLELVLIVIVPAAIILGFWYLQQATPGKILVGARIVDVGTGARPAVRQLVVRLLGYFVSALPFFLGFLWVALKQRKQGWHDRIAGTVVISATNLR